jgi:signal transduction histidine kinase
VLLLVYVAISGLVLASVQRRPDPRLGTQLLAHLLDLLLPFVIRLLVPGSEALALALFLLPLIGAAARWGGRAALATASAEGGLALALQATSPPLLPLALPGFGEAAFVLAAGALVGYLASAERQRRAEAVAVLDLLARPRFDRGFRYSLVTVLGDLLRIFDAKGARLIVRDQDSGRAYLWELNAPDDREESLRCREITAAEAGAVEASINPDIRERQAVVPPLTAQFVTGEWSGRVVLRDPAASSTAPEAVRFFAHLVQQVAPALYTVFSVRRLRTKAAVLERGRLARQLHDGVIQTLLGVEMQIDVMRRGAAGGADQMARQLDRIQEILRQEVLDLRELMLQMKPLDLNTDALPEFVGELVDRFARDSGVEATFTGETDHADLTRKGCAEVVRIVQEALSNIRKHSGARHASVSLRSAAGGLVLVIADDGRGFPFEGQVTVLPDDAREPGQRGGDRVEASGVRTAHRPRPSVPAAIRESVRALGGSLTIVSAPGRGARLVITIPAAPIVPTSTLERLAS